MVSVKTVPESEEISETEETSGAVEESRAPQSTRRAKVKTIVSSHHTYKKEQPKRCSL
jgi:hypothetical protein